MSGSSVLRAWGRWGWLALLTFGLAVPVCAAPRGMDGSFPTRPQSDSVVGRLLARVQTAFSAGQAVVVRAASESDTHAVLARYEMKGRVWHRVGAPIPAVLGVSGITLDKREGDGKSPAGIFRFGRAFGSAPAPAGLQMPYTRTTHYDYWVDDPQSADYNRWVTTFGDPHQLWRSFEKLDIPAYRYAAVIGYNTRPIVSGRGSAIFLHVWPGPDGHTVGCTAIAEKQLVILLRWLNPAKRPVIIQGTATQLDQLVAGGK